VNQQTDQHAGHETNNCTERQPATTLKSQGRKGRKCDSLSGFFKSFRSRRRRIPGNRPDRHTPQQTTSCSQITENTSCNAQITTGTDL